MYGIYDIIYSDVCYIVIIQGVNYSFVPGYVVVNEVDGTFGEAFNWEVRSLCGGMVN